MQPYQRASEAIRSGNELPLHLIKNAGLTALGGGAASVGSKAVSKLLPAIGAMISKYVPENIAKAGLEKIDPRLGKFVKGAESEGYNFDEIRQNISERLEQSQQAQKPPEQKNLIEQSSPNLHKFIVDQIQQGRSPIEAGALAEMSGKFKKEIKELIKQHKAPWSSIIESVFGGAGEAKQTQQSNQSIQGQQPQQGQANQAQGGLDPQLAQILQGMQQTMSRIRGR